MAKSTKKKILSRNGKADPKPLRKSAGKLAAKSTGKSAGKSAGKSKKSGNARVLPVAADSGAGVLDRLFAVVESRRDADPTISHSARLLSRGPAKVAQKFGEEAVECLIEAVAGNRDAMIGESADVLYHLLVLWVSAGIDATDVWAELMRREGISGIAEKAARAKPMAVRRAVGTSKIP
jgi:phosphoribosyl-ATP pyrophosphohydrolase